MAVLLNNPNIERSISVRGHRMRRTTPMSFARAIKVGLMPASPALDQVAGWPAPHAAAIVTDPYDTVADTGDVAAVHGWASVTKLVTGYAVLQLAEAGDLDLDEPYGPPESTVRHLLAHASGLPFDGTSPVAKPGRRRIYSNGGFDLLGSLVEERSGETLGAYVGGAIFAPLGMTSSAITGTPSAGGFGSTHDLALFARELLAPTLLSAEVLTTATSIAFPGLDGVLPGFGRCNPNDWGLGFELHDSKDPHWMGRDNSAATLGHFGQSGSFVWVDPELKLGCVALCGEKFGAWAAQAWPPFSDAVIAEFGLPTRPFAV
jgi:CubicO group peptidase (beta-lactamase class C family)